MLLDALSILCAVIVGFAAWAAVMPLVRTGHWVARVCDFPRLQLATIAAVAACVSFALYHARPGAFDATVALVGAALALVQAAQVLPYTRIWRTDVPDHDGTGRTIRLLIANIDYTNDRESEIRETLAGVDVDALLLVEIDRRWDAALRTVRDGFRASAGVVRDSGVGLTLDANIEIGDARVEHLVSPDRPSIHGTFHAGEADPVRFVALHPTPPGIDNFESGEGRTDSHRRDAELVGIARLIREDPAHHWIVFGDLNDVAWSHTTRLFRRLAGMKDPRIGRALLNTFDARRWWLRYPLDHAFVSPGLRVARLERLGLPGSDHFGVLVEIGIPADAGPNTGEAGTADAADRDEACRIEAEGRREAREA
jgi:endonuclease/exonuclease/phosphatase (EEP) superfamily protein YafD